MDDYSELGRSCLCECDDCRNGLHDRCRDKCGKGSVGRDSFHAVVARLIGQAVRVQACDTAFCGRLACVETTFISVAGHPPYHEGAEGDGGRTQVTFIPFRKVCAVTVL